VKLTVMVVVIPSATQRSITSSPADVTGSLTAMFGAQASKRRAISSIAERSPASQGLTCAQSTGLVVAPTAPFSRAASSSPGSPESCHRVVRVSDDSHWRSLRSAIVQLTPV
jgi:hypothetical protein